MQLDPKRAQQLTSKLKLMEEEEAAAQMMEDVVAKASGDVG